MGWGSVGPVPRQALTIRSDAVRELLYGIAMPAPGTYLQRGSVRIQSTVFGTSQRGERDESPSGSDEGLVLRAETA
jgi:hypothetical protein